jgi:hypothetical protein
MLGDEVVAVLAVRGLEQADVGERADDFIGGRLGAGSLPAELGD